MFRMNNKLLSNVATIR